MKEININKKNVNNILQHIQYLLKNQLNIVQIFVQIRQLNLYKMIRNYVLIIVKLCMLVFQLVDNVKNVINHNFMIDNN